MSTRSTQAGTVLGDEDGPFGAGRTAGRTNFDLPPSPRRPGRVRGHTRACMRMSPMPNPAVASDARCVFRFVSGWLHRVACTVRGHPLPVPPVCPSDSPGYILHTRLLRRQGDSHPTTGLVSRRQAGTRDMSVAAAPLPRSRARLAGSPQPAGDPRVSSLICIFSIPWLGLV